jgi:hypothetical protein
MSRALTKGELALAWAGVAVLIAANWFLAGSVTTGTAVGSIVALTLIFIPRGEKPNDLLFVALAVGTQLFSIALGLLHA